MSDSIADDLDILPAGAVWRLKILTLLIFFGLLVLAAERSTRFPDSDSSRQCRPFALGVSAVGGCDWLVPPAETAGDQAPGTLEPVTRK